MDDKVITEVVFDRRFELRLSNLAKFESYGGILNVTVRNREIEKESKQALLQDLEFDNSDSLSIESHHNFDLDEEQIEYELRRNQINTTNSKVAQYELQKD